MSGTKEIRTKISSVKNTQKITSAMEMVAASKMRKAQERMAASKPYSQKIRAVIKHLANANPEYRHVYMEQRDVKKVGVIVVSTDRGLCGGLNINLFKKVIGLSRDYSEQNVDVDLCLVGKKSASFFKSVGGNVVATVSGLGDQPRIEDLIGAVKVMLAAYDSGELD